jgi:hypothetical protein
MRLFRLVSLLCVFAVRARHPLHAQPPVPSISVSISSTAAETKPLILTAADLSAMPRTSTTVVSNGISTVYEGVLLHEVLKRAGVSFGAGMRGGALAGYVVASASDGYRVVFSLGELDPDLTDNQYLLADSANGKPLFGETGAFRLLVPKDKRGARSVRMLSALTVVQLTK